MTEVCVVSSQSSTSVSPITARKVAYSYDALPRVFMCLSKGAERSWDSGGYNGSGVRAPSCCPYMEHNPPAGSNSTRASSRSAGQRSTSSLAGPTPGAKWLHQSAGCGQSLFPGSFRCLWTEAPFPCWLSAESYSRLPEATKFLTISNGRSRPSGSVNLPFLIFCHIRHWSSASISAWKGPCDSTRLPQ